MVNRVMVVVLAAIVVTAMAVGVLAGMQFADDGSSSVPGTPTPTATTTTTAQTTTATTTTATTTTATTTTATTTATTTTATTTATTTTTEEGVSPATVDATAVEAAIRAKINSYRRGKGLSELGAFRNLTAMARFHSENMATQGYPSHVAGGFTPLERYDRFGLGDRCRLSTGARVRDGQELEVIDRIQPDTTDETDIGRRIAQGWIDDRDSRRKLDLDAASWAGIGVTVTERGSVYATLNLC